MSVEMFKALGVPLLAMIEAGAASDSLREAPFNSAIVRAWSYLAGTENVRAWISEGVMASASFLARLATGLLLYSPGPGGRRYSLETVPEPFYDLNVIREACKRHASADGLSKDELSRIHALKVGIDKLDIRQKGGGGIAP